MRRVIGLVLAGLGDVPVERGRAARLAELAVEVPEGHGPDAAE